MTVLFLTLKGLKLKIVFFLTDDRAVLVEAELSYIQQHVTPSEEFIAVVFINDGSTGVCPVSWITEGEKTEEAIVTIDWEETSYQSTILKISSKYTFLYSLSKIGEGVHSIF